MRRKIILGKLIKYLEQLEQRFEAERLAYDEQYLNGKIAAAEKNWRVVDADKWLCELRGEKGAKND
jgi:hypothetical protein